MNRRRLLVVIVITVASLGWVATRGLSQNLVYYTTPTELLQKGPGAVGERLRIGGYVVPGSLLERGNTDEFVMTDGTNRLSVISTGGVPALFRSGQGVVVEGVYGADGILHADTVLVKHDGEYSPPDPGQTPGAASLAED